MQPIASRGVYQGGCETLEAREQRSLYCEVQGCEGSCQDAGRVPSN